MAFQTAIDVPDAIVLATAETFVPFTTISRQVSEWVEGAHDLFIQDLFRQGGEVETWVRMRGDASDRKFRYPRDWGKSLAALAIGDATSISIGAAVPIDAIRGAKTFRLWVTPVPGAPEVTRIRFFARPDALINEIVPPPTVWSTAIQDGAVALRAVDGWLTISRAAIVGTAYEDHLLRPPLVGVQEARVLLRGFFWGTLLSSLHIEALGGVGRVLHDAPVERVVDLVQPEHELMYLELTSDLFEVTEAHEERLRGYLAPLLPSVGC